MNPFTNGAVSSATAAGTALWIFSNFFFLAIAQTLAATETDKQYFGDYRMLAAAESAEQTGRNGTVNAQELTAIMHLAFPQQYTSIVRRFGMPFSRNGRFDFYKIEGAGNWVAIWYEGNPAKATGYIIISGY